MTDNTSQNNKDCYYWTQRKPCCLSTDFNGPKFYSKSLTLLLSILKMIDEGFTASEIAKKFNLSKQRVSYHICNLKKSGYVNEKERDAFKILTVTQAGKNFVAMYQHLSTMSICRAENIRFKASIYKIPSLPVDWHKVEMHNWNQYTTEVDCVKVKLNDTDNPTIESYYRIPSRSNRWN